LRGLTTLVLALIVVLVAAGAALYYGSITGFMLSGESNTPQTDLSGLVIGTPMSNQPDTGTGQISASGSSGTQPANGTSTQQNQTTNRTTTTTGSSGGGSGGGSSGGGGDGSGGGCTPSWSCAAWSACSQQGSQTRTCTDTACGSSSRTETQNCTYTPPEEPEVSGGCNGICLMPKTLDINMSQNSTFGTYVYINTTESVYAVDFNFYYDGGKTNATNATEGGFLKQDGTKTYPIITIDYANSKIRCADTRMGNQSGVSGSEVLMNVIFSADAAGMANLSLGNVRVVGSNLQPMNITVSGSSVINITV